MRKIVTKSKEYSDSKDADTNVGKPFRFEVGADKESMKTSILNHLRYTLARHPECATKDEWWTATCYAVRDRLLDRFMKTQATHNEKSTPCVLP